MSLLIFSIDKEGSGETRQERTAIVQGCLLWKAAKENKMENQESKTGSSVLSATLQQISCNKLH